MHPDGAARQGPGGDGPPAASGARSRRPQPERDRFRWSLIISVWLHLVVLLLLQQLGGLLEDTLRPRAGTLRLVELRPADVRLAAGPDGSRSGGSGGDGTGAPNDASSGQATDGTQAPTTASGTLLPPDPSVIPPVRDVAAAPTEQAPDASSAPPVPTDLDPLQDPADAVAEGARNPLDAEAVRRDVRAEPLERPDRQDREPPEPDPEREPELLPPPEPPDRDPRAEEEEPPPPKEEEPPPPEEEPEQEDDGWLDYVNLGGEEDHAPLTQADADFVSGVDRQAEQSTRVEVTARKHGAPTPEVHGVASQAAPARKQPREGDDPGSPGSRPREAEPREAEVAGADGGGHRGDQSGRGAPTRGGTSTAGGPAAQAAQGGGSPGATSAPPVAASTGGAAGPSEAPDGEERLAAAADSWWQPMVSRIVVAEPAPAATVIQAVPPSPTRGPAVAVVEREGTEQAEASREAEHDEEVAPGDVEAPEEGQEPEEEAGLADPVNDLRVALGWGPIDRESLAPRSAQPGVSSTDGAEAASAQAVLPEENPLADVVMITAAETPEGRYRQKIDQIILDAWYEQDLDPHTRALGIQGTTTVVFRVSSGGRVSDVEVVQSSGHVELDRMAMAAVPRRLPRFPRDVERDALWQQVAFRYRNPLIASDAPPAP